MSEKIIPSEIAAETGLEQDEVEAVLQELMGDWLYRSFVAWGQ